MDYKEKYEQALKIAQETYDTQPMYREWLEKMFPELAESEGERIRKRIIHALHGDVLDMEETNIAIAWLENIPVTIDHEKREGFHLGYKAGFEEQGEHKPTDEEMKTLLRTEYEKGRADAIAEIQNRWKPSDEHIRFLQAMVNDPNNASSESCQIVLKDILEKLKKLKEG